MFGELIDHHAKEEENTMFKMARKLFTTEERSLLDEDYEAWKSSDAAKDALAAEKAKANVKAVVKASKN